jgi:hypothetical protein
LKGTHTAVGGAVVKEKHILQEREAVVKKTVTAVKSSSSVKDIGTAVRRSCKGNTGAGVRCNCIEGDKGTAVKRSYNAGDIGTEVRRICSE